MFLAALTPGLPTPAQQQARTAMTRWLPSGTPRSATWGPLWWLLVEAPGTYANRSQTWEEPGCQVLFLGELFNPEDHNPARQVASLWQRHGNTHAITTLNGSFTTILVTPTGEVHVVSDDAGRSAPRHAQLDNGALLLASHDAALVATGMIPWQLRRETMAACLTVDWSLGGESLFTTIHPMKAGEHLRWRPDTGLEKVFQPVWQDIPRLAPEDEAGMTRQTEYLLDAARRRVRGLVAGRDNVTLGMTGGVDSRVLCALTRAELPPAAFELVTVGGANSPDARIAREVAQCCGLRFRLKSFHASPTVANAFLANARQQALFTNGTASILYALRDPFTPPDARTINLHGTAGENFRGYYYKHLDGARLAAGEVAGVLQGVLMRKQVASLLQPGLRQGVAGHIATLVGELARHSPDPHDQLDLFYSLERARHWGNNEEKAPWMWNRASPFHAPELLRLARALPPPMGKHGMAFFRLAVSRHLPAAYQLPTGPGSQPLNPLLQPRREKPWEKSWRYYKARGLQELARRFPGRFTGQADAYVQAGWLLADHHGEFLRETLLAADSPLLEVVEQAVLARLLDDHVSKRALATEVIGNALGITLFLHEMKGLKHGGGDGPAPTG